MAINKSDRARQFLPFDALKGLQEALHEKEIELECEDKRELSDEQCEIISSLLNKVKNGTKLDMIYYRNKRYVKYIGTVSRVDRVKKKIIFKDENVIYFDDIFKLELI